MRALWLFSLCFLLGCGDPGTTAEADGGGRDAGRPDVEEEDGGSSGETDAGTQDSGARDSGAEPGEDAGAPDAGCTPGSAGTPEAYCNGVDDDCDGVVDEGFADAAGTAVVIGAPCDGPDEGSCGADGTTDPNPGVWICPFDQTGPATCNEPDIDDFEVCDDAGADEDCDGVVDEFPTGGGAVARRGDPCVQGGLASDVAPACGGTYQCGSTSSLACIASTAPGTEACNGLDDDCDGTIDEDSTSTEDCGPTQSPMRCGGTWACNGGVLECMGSTPAQTGYQDNDGDTYGAGSAQSYCGALPAGMATRGGDCCDSDSNSHPGVGPNPAWHSRYQEPNACGSFDWNCSGSVQRGRIDGVNPTNCGNCGRDKGWVDEPSGWSNPHRTVCEIPCGYSNNFAVDPNGIFGACADVDRRTQWCY